MMTMIRRSKEQYVAYVKGAPDILLQNCSRLLVNGEEVPLGQEELKKILEVNDSLAKQALRVLGCAYRVMPSLPEKMDASSIEKDLIFTGLVAMIDPRGVKPLKPWENASRLESSR